MKESIQKYYGVNLDDSYNRAITDAWDNAQEKVQRYVSLRLRVQNGVSRLISALCVNCLISIPCTMRKLSECYSGIFQTQSSGCVSGLDHFTNFTNLKILNI